MQIDDNNLHDPIGSGEPKSYIFKRHRYKKEILLFSLIYLQFFQMSKMHIVYLINDLQVNIKINNKYSLNKTMVFDIQPCIAMYIIKLQQRSLNITFIFTYWIRLPIYDRNK